MALSLSLLLHGSVILLLLLESEAERRMQRAPSLYSVAILPREKKLIYYDFRQKLPEVNPLRRIGKAEVPQGREKKPGPAIIAQPPGAKPGRQLIWQPEPKRELEEDIRAPNVVAVSAPPNPEPARPKPRVFIPPKQLPAQPAPSMLVTAEPPAVVAQIELKKMGAMLLGGQPKVLPKPQPKAFAPPTAKPRLELPSVIEEAPPDVKTGASVLAGRGPGLPGEVTTRAMLASRPAAKKFVPPRGGAGNGKGGGGTGPVFITDAPPEVSGGSGLSQANLAVVGLQPSDRLEAPIPEGATRTASLSQAPNFGVPASGRAPGNSGVAVPNLAIRNSVGAPEPAPTPVNPPSRSSMSLETVLKLPMSTLSVPLRPSSRTIPGAIDAWFQGRNVYTLVIPIENVPAYAGDWILWFAEHEQKPGETPQIHAPVPLRKVEPLDVAPAFGPGGRPVRVQLIATINKNGRTGAVAVLRNAASALNKSAIEDLQRWEFRPATRNGTPVDVDVVIEIPYRVSAGAVER